MLFDAAIAIRLVQPSNESASTLALSGMLMEVKEVQMKNANTSHGFRNYKRFELSAVIEGTSRN